MTVLVIRARPDNFPGKGPMQPETNGSLVKCCLCEKSLESRKSFACKGCKKSPFCLEHLDPEYKVCSGCATEERIRLYNNLLRQEKGVKGFLRLTQFILVMAIIFLAARNLVHEHIPEFIRENMFFEYVFVWGGAAALGIILCYVIISSQKQKMKEIDGKIHDHKVYSFVTLE